MYGKRIAILVSGSLEQTLCLAPAIAALRDKNPGAEFSLIAPEHHREVAALLSGIDHFVTEEEPAGAYTHTYDLRTAAPTTGAENPDWKAYLLACAPIAGSNPFHMADILRKAVGVGYHSAGFELAAPEAAAEEQLPESLTGGNVLRVSICASSLEIDELQAILQGLADSSLDLAVHLLGTLADRRKSSLLSSAWQDRLEIYDLCGKQAVTEQAATWRRSDLAFTNAGLSALLSSGYGTFTICVDTERKPLFQPYGHGHLVIQHCGSDDFHRTLATLTAEATRYTVMGHGGNVPTLEQWQTFADERIDNYLGRLRVFGQQRVEILTKKSGSFTEIYQRPFIFLGATREDLNRVFHRLLWEHSLEGRVITTDDLSVLHEETAAYLSGSLAAMQQLYELADFGRKYSELVHQSLTRNDIPAATHDSARLQEVDELVQSLGLNHPMLQPLCAFHALRQQTIPEMLPLDVAAQMKLLFMAMQERVLVLLDLTRTLFHTTLRDEAAAHGVAEAPSDG